MSRDPYDQETDEEFHRMMSHSAPSPRPRAGVVRSPEERKAMGFQLLGCSAFLLSGLLGVAIIALTIIYALRVY